MPADLSRYCTADDIELLLRSASFWPTDAKKQALAREQAGIAAQAAAEEWESRVGWGPFLASGEPETRYLERMTVDGELDLQGGMVEVQSIKGGTSSMLDLARVRAVKAQAGGSRARPIVRLALGYGAYGGYSSYGYGYGEYSGGYGNMGQGYEVTGLWGCVESVPADVWQQIQQKAALTTLEQIENLQSIGSIAQAGFSKSFDVVGIISQKDLSDLWGKGFNRYANIWARVTM